MITLDLIKIGGAIVLTGSVTAVLVRWILNPVSKKLRNISDNSACVSRLDVKVDQHTEYLDNDHKAIKELQNRVSELDIKVVESNAIQKKEIKKIFEYLRLLIEATLASGDPEEIKALKDKMSKSLLRDLE